MFRKIIFFASVFIIAILILINAFILLSGKFYLYKGIWNTYLKGRTGPSATEYTIFENRKIEALNPHPLNFSVKYNSATLPAPTDSIFKKYNTIAFVIIKNDSLYHEQYWDGFSDTTHTNSFSIAKSFVSALLGCAIKDGYFKSINDTAAKYIPEFYRDERKNITLKHLVSMTSGIGFNESYMNPVAYPAEGYYGEDVYATSTKYSYYEMPGKVFRYMSGNSALLGVCITKATGKPLSNYLSERLWKDLECEQPAWWSLDKKNGFEKGFCCLNSNAKDFARLGMLYLNHGKWKGKQIIDSDFVASSIVPYECNEEDGCKNRTYGYSWWLTSYNNQDIFYARGILGQYVICNPKEKTVIVKLGLEKRPKTSNNHCPDDVATCIETANLMYP